MKERHNEFIFSMINKKLNETLNNNRYEIRDMIIENVSLKNDLVIDLTDRIILNLINIKIPSFIDEMKDNIINTSFNFLDENILSENIPVTLRTISGAEPSWIQS